MPARFKCQFDMENAAFEDDYAHAARDILVDIERRLLRYDTGGTIRDVNGNTIGKWSIR